jgi:hypothetical protein
MLADTPFGIDKGGKQIDRAQQVPIEVRPVAFSRTLLASSIRSSTSLGSYRDMSRYFGIMGKGICECLKIHTFSAQAFSDSFG